MVALVNRKFDKHITMVTAFRLTNISLLADHIYAAGEATIGMESALEGAVDTMDETLKLYQQDGE